MSYPLNYINYINFLNLKIKNKVKDINTDGTLQKKAHICYYPHKMTSTGWTSLGDSI